MNYIVSKKSLNAIILTVLILAGYIYPSNSIASSLEKARNELMDMQAKLNELRKIRLMILEFTQKCTTGDDDSCIRVGVDPKDPCRRYLVMNDKLYACRVLQCRNGNQNECNKLEKYANKSDTIDNEQEKNKGKLAKRICEKDCFSEKVNCNRGCSYCFGSSCDSSCDSRCRNDYQLCKSRCK
jgi:hypothetical protein